MPLQSVQFAAQSYKDRSLPVSAQRCINLYLEAKPQGSKSPVALHGTPGLKSFATCGDGPIRGIIGMGSLLYVVSGKEVYRVTSSGAATLAGTVTGNRPVVMAQNGNEVVVVSDYDDFFVTETGLGQLSVSNHVGVDVLDGYAVFAERNSQKFIISALNDATTFDATEFALANALPDNLTGLRVAGQHLWVFGERSAQVYYNSGQVDFPFSRLPAGVIHRGCLAPRSIAEYSGVLWFLGDDKRVYQTEGLLPAPISTHAIEREISTYQAPEEAVGFTYQQEGHIFYVLTFAEATWVFDVSTGIWHERLSEGLTKWRAQGHAYWFQKNFVGDAVNGKVYELDLDTYTDDGNTIRRIATAPPIHANRRRFTMLRFELDLEGGVGLITGQGSDPQAMIQWSDDATRSWSNEYWRDIGEIGEYRTKVRWSSLGQSRERVMKVEISDPVKVAIIEAYADLEVGEA